MMSGSLVSFPSAPKTLVVDAWPVMEWLKGKRPAAEQFESLLESCRRVDVHLVISTINLGEIYYGAWKEWGEAIADHAIRDLTALPIQIIHPSSDDVIRAAKLKARFRISYADAFAAVLAIGLGEPVLTGDKDFRVLEEAGLVTLEWIGA